jgi:hypothetical protein
MGLPDFVIPGCQYCGTATLQHNLALHPDVWFPDGDEMQFFNTHWDKGRSWYADLYQKGPSNARKGDRTYVLTYLPQYAARMASTLPRSTKIILCLRNPVDRAIAHFEGYRQRSGADQPIEYYLERELAEIERNRHPTPETAPTDFIRRGMYFAQIRRMQKHFNDVHIVIAEQLYDRACKVTFETLDFLGLSPYSLTWLQPHQQRHEQYDVAFETRRMLADLYALEIERVFNLIGYEVEEWG